MQNECINTWFTIIAILLLRRHRPQHTATQIAIRSGAIANRGQLKRYATATAAAEEETESASRTFLLLRRPVHLLLLLLRSLTYFYELPWLSFIQCAFIIIIRRLIMCPLHCFTATMRRNLFHTLFPKGDPIQWGILSPMLIAMLVEFSSTCHATETRMVENPRLNISRILQIKWFHSYCRCE